MLDDPAKTRATLSKSLAHLPPDVRGEAVDAIMGQGDEQAVRQDSGHHEARRQRRRRHRQGDA